MRKLSDYPAGVKRVLHRRKVEKNRIRILEKYRGQKIYYVIRPHLEQCGLGTTIRCVLSHVKYAREQNYTPVMDYRSFANPYLNADEVGKKNAWEFFFEPLGGVRLEDIRGLENVFVTEESQLAVCPTDSLEFYTNPYCVAYWRELFRTYIRLNEETKAYIKEQKEQILGPDGTRTLGCIVRGTDYVGLRALNHPIQPHAEDVIEKARQMLENGTYDRIFLATEDAGILDKFVEAFGDKVHFVEQQRYTDGSQFLSEQKDFAAKTSKREEGLQYLTAIYLLGMCTSLIGGRCGITTISYLISEGYEEEYLWNIGRYQTDDYCLPEKYL
jgi:hypothetical protein